MKLAKVNLDDKYSLENGRIYITGTQALVRLPMLQRQRDMVAGLNTAGFISGYRGSPLGALDQQLWQASKFLDKNNIKFQPGVNEDLAATAIWGTQQSQLFNDSIVDGVFGIWYGKGPGVDRTGDVFKHANAAGTSKYGGVLALAGDDHTCKSSTLAHQSEYAFVDAMMPVLAPSGVQEFIDLGIHGFSLSRYSGLWVAFKTVAESVDSTASVYIDPHRMQIKLPTDFHMPDGGLNIRINHPPLEQEELLHKHKIYAALAYAKANNLNHTIINSPKRRLGIITAGKSYLDLRQALDDLAISDDYAKELGISIYKVGMVWPLERDGIRQFAEGQDEILVVEEKRALIENQLKEQLYNWRSDVRPRVVGKFDENGNWLLTSTNELTPANIARVLVQRLKNLPNSKITNINDKDIYDNDKFNNRLDFLEAKEKSLETQTASIKRIPYFCSGCPHNISTKLPEGSRALAGIGCHYMVRWMDRETNLFTQMGGEGVPWVGMSSFSKTNHVFANLGDGTYFHSGLLAFRQSAASGVNITYKILYNDAVAMTGGQPHDGNISVSSIAHQVTAEGAKMLAIVTDEPEKYGSGSIFPAGTKIYHRRDLDKVQRQFREVKGISAIIYDQTCAAEKRRRRKRGTFPDPAKRVFINAAVCEGCGDCGTASNCMSIYPKETEYGRKRMIDQSSCNKDYSCVYGFCPSFITIHGGKLRKGTAAGQDNIKKNAIDDIFANMPEPKLPNTDKPYGILLTGVGGTGVVTIASLLGMAAHIENKGISILDMAGLAQKGGAVTSHIRIANNPEDINAVRIAAGGAKLLLGCDMVVAANFDSLAKIEHGFTKAVINIHETVTGDFTKQPDFMFPADEIKKLISDATGSENVNFVEAGAIATALMGDSIATNLFMLGFAYQKSLIPISKEAIFKAIELNGVAMDNNKQSFIWGRRGAYDMDSLVKIIGKDKASPKQAINIATSLDDIIEKRMIELEKYQNIALANKYKNMVNKVAAIEKNITNDSDYLTKAVARYYYKILAYKDEYEVARLYSSPEFKQNIAEQFEGDYKIHFHLAAPFIARRNLENGRLIKGEFGPYMMRAFGILKYLKFLRGTVFDVFSYTDERSMERQLIKDYEKNIKILLAGLNKDNLATAIEIATLPEHIRGFGHVKEKHIADTHFNEVKLLNKFNQC